MQNNIFSVFDPIAIGFRFLFSFFFFLFSFFLLPIFSFSQEITDPQKNFIIEKRIEMIAEANEETEIDYTTLFDELSFIYEHPLDLNSVEKEQLDQLTLLTDAQVNNLLKHIKKNGKLISIYELQSIDGFNLETIQTILPFVKVADRFETTHIGFKEIFKNSSSQLILRETRIFEQQEGYKPIDDSALAAKPNSRYLGSSDRLYARYRFQFSNKISFGITGEKDAGEEFFKGTQKKGFDFYSAHFYLRNFGKIKHLAVGDYQASFGQGLTFFSGLGFGKTADVANIKKNALPVRPYVSAGESLFLRGAASTVAIKSFEITGFYSMKKADASIAQSSDTSIAQDDFIITSLITSGYHRTPSEISKKNTVNETILGGNINYKKRRGNIGITAAQTQWGGQIQRNPSVYNQFALSGNRNTNIGADYSYIIRNLNFFGEVARSENGGMAFLNGAIASLSPDVNVSLLHRNYQRNYQVIYTRALGESATANNEKGFYFGLNARINSSFTFSGYIDRFEFPWLKYLIYAPSKGMEYLGQFTYKPSKKIEMYVRYRHEMKQANAEDVNSTTYYLSETSKQNMRLNSSYKVNNFVTFRNRIEFLKYQKGELQPEYGYLIFQDVMYKSKSMKFPFSCSFRFALFETDTYNARIYAYENDVLYSFSIPAYYYRGTRTYIILQYKLFRKVDIWLRWGQTYYSNRDVVGSGLDEIEGNTKTEVKAQIRYKF